MDRRTVEIGSGGRVLRVRLSRRLQNRGQAARGRVRCEVHEQRTLWLEGDRGADENKRLAQMLRFSIGNRRNAKSDSLNAQLGQVAAPVTWQEDDAELA